MWDGLAAGAATLGNWKEALAYREVVALTSANGGIGYGVYYLRNRFQILVARGALAMQNGDVAKAVSSFVEAHRILPRDGYLANELFPVMREAGLSELHDQLFGESARHARKVIQMFPKDDNAHNNFAWLASRANRSLDEAEEYLKIALKINPRSAAYLDTMGEIYFARRNREEALKWSALSLQNQVFGGSASRWELHQQNQRFKSGKFPVR
jgi:tetratricopeptide (TPR) repeat protein